MIRGVSFEVAVVAVGFAIGSILPGHFEEGTPRWRRVAKLFLALGIRVSGRARGSPRPDRTARASRAANRSLLAAESPCS